MNAERIKEALSGIKVSAYDTNERAVILTPVMKSLFLMKGMDGEKYISQLDEMTKMLNDRLAESFPTLTMDEVKLALEAGICGDFDVPTSISISNILGWLKAYRVCDARREAKASLTPPRESISPEETQRLNEAAQKRGLQKLQDVILSGDQEDIRYHFFQMAGRADGVYQLLIDHGYMKHLTDETLEAARQEVKGAFFANGMMGLSDITDDNTRLHAAILKRYLTTMLNAGKRIVL